ncbi:cuticle collagen 2-like [Sceloporus undulatus]|uniref:cuticle collagen 2-like n=1 Tax=Sceloporus undulatus TaxID=8520 RepID=UPI001C4CF376|nr:cuticle collagen 2-like [Sceloporus undulatus]
MNSGCRGRWPFLGATPVVLLLVLCLHLQGSDSRCIDVVLGQDLQPLPPGVQRCSLPSGLLQPDVSLPGQGRDAPDGGDSRIVGGSPATSGAYGGGEGGSTGGSGSPTSRPPSQGDRPFQTGKPNRPGQAGRPEGAVFGGRPGQYSGPRQPGPYGSGPSQYGPGPVREARPGSSVQYGGVSEQYGGVSYEGPASGIRYNYPQGHPRPEWKAPGIPYIPSPKEWGGGYIPIRKGNPNAPYEVPYGGGAGSYNSGQRYPSAYGGGGGGSMDSGPRGRYDGSYGPIPESLQPGGGQRGREGVDRGPPCDPNC